MDRTSKAGKFIRLQFFALWMMILLTLWMAMYARGANDLQAFWKKEVDFILPELGRLERQHDADQKLIQAQKASLAQMDMLLGKHPYSFVHEGNTAGRINGLPWEGQSASGVSKIDSARKLTLEELRQEAKYRKTRAEPVYPVDPLPARGR